MRAAVERILASEGFRSSDRLTQFLRFVVDESLAGGHLKEYSIGVAVYNRPESYDPRVDATVRVEAGKLRQRLREYYETEGRADPLLITIPKGGYAPVFQHRDAETPAPAVAARHPRRLLLFAGAAGIAVLAAAGIWWTQFRDRPVRLSTHRLISTFPGSHRSAAFSPDGSMIAFISSAAGAVPQVWVKSLAEGAPVQITSGDLPAARPRWSPKGDRIVFERRGISTGIAGTGSVRGGIWSVPPLGGAEHKIIEAGKNPNFSSDGEWLVYEFVWEIWIAKADGSEARRLHTAPTRYLNDMAPAFSPDGRWIAFFQPETGPNGDLWVIPAAGGEARRLTHDVKPGGTPVWAPDGRSILYSSARSGSSNLWRVSASGGAPEPVTTGAGVDSEPVISADGKRLIFTNVRHSWSLMLLEAGSQAPRRLITQRTNIAFPVFSPDGKQVAFFQDLAGTAHLFTVGADGQGLRQITRTSGEVNVFPQWSEDGSSLYYYRVLPVPSFRKVAHDGSGSIEVAPFEFARHFRVQMDPSGRAAVYEFRDAGRPMSTVVRVLATGQEKILGSPIHSPRWSQDGREILGWTDDNHVRICPAEGGECTTFTSGSRARWSSDGSQVYFFRTAQTPGWFDLWSASRDGSREKRITPMGPFRSLEIHFDVSREGQIIWAPFQEGEQELWLADLTR